MTRNDDLVNEAIVEVLVELGWPGFTLRNVASRAGVSRQAVTDRFPDRPHMAVHAWQTTFSGTLHGALDRLLAAHGLCDGEPSTVEEAWKVFRQPTGTMRGALELVMQAPFEPLLHEAVDAVLGPLATRWTWVASARGSRTQATQRAYLIARALGFLAMGSIVRLDDVDVGPADAAVAEAIAHPARARRIQIDAPPQGEIVTGHERLDALLRATLRNVATVGYDAASVDAICRDAGVTKGFLFHRYANKQALFVDAAKVRQSSAIRASTEWLATVAARHGQARAEAAFVRTVLHPDRIETLRVSSEELHVALHDDGLAASFASTAAAVAKSALGRVDGVTLGYAHHARAAGEGIGLLTILDPGAWSLPFEVVLVPLQAALTRNYLADTPPEDATASMEGCA